MTMLHLLRRNNSWKPFITAICYSPIYIARFDSRRMNTLQEGSKVYKALKNGGPSFGAWQVRGIQDLTVREDWY